MTAHKCRWFTAVAVASLFGTVICEGSAPLRSGLRRGANYFAAQTRQIGGDVVPNQSQDQVLSRMIGKWNYQAKAAAEEGQVWEFTSEPYSGTVLPAHLSAETLPAKVFVAKIYQADGTLKREAGYGLATDSKFKDTQAKILKARRAGKDCYLLYMTYAQKKDSGIEFKNDWRPMI